MECPTTRKLRGTVALLGAMLCSSAAAQVSGPWYFGLDFLAAYAFLGDAEVSGSPTLATTALEDDDLVFGGQVQLGRALTSSLRAEIEYTWRYRLDFNADVQGPAPLRLKSDVHSQSAMLNFLWDLAPRGGWRPYLGAGAGVVHHRTSTSRNVRGSPVDTNIDNTQTNLALALHAGALYRLTRHWYGKLGYRFAALGEVDSGAYADGLRLNAENYWSNGFSVGLQFRF